MTDESDASSGDKIRRYDPESEAIIEVTTQAEKRPVKKRKSCRAVTTKGMAVVAGIGRTIGKVGMGLLVLSAILAVCAGATPPEDAEGSEGEKIDEACRGVLRDRLESANRSVPPSSRRCGDSLLVQELKPGYNCRGHVWAGPARTETVLDTGSTRNSVDKAYLRELLAEPKTQGVVTGVKEIAPLTCRSVDRNNPIVVKQIAFINVTLKESEDNMVTKNMGFCIVPEH